MSAKRKTRPARVREKIDLVANRAWADKYKLKPARLENVSPEEFEAWLEKISVPSKPYEFGDWFFLEPAKARADWAVLEDYRGRKFPITPAMEKFLAEIWGKKRPSRRPEKLATQTRALEVGCFVHLQKQAGERNPIQQAKTLFNMSRRSVQTAARAFEKLNDQQKDFVLAAMADWRIYRSRGAIK
jgi:hypothetical protein